MAGAGRRFVEAGYKLSKPLIPTTSRLTGKKTPMIISALMDLPGAQDRDTRVILIDRNFHQKEGVEERIKEYIPQAEFITIDYLTEGQASTCLLAKEMVNNDHELTIGACDNGMDLDLEKFQTIKESADVLLFTYRHNEAVLENPKAYGWAKVKEDGETIERMSVKVPISNDPINDHAVVGSFWFKRGHDFITATERMIEKNDRINNEFYVDQVIQHCLELGLTAKVFEVDRYHCWGTPKEYENYEDTIEYWKEFLKEEKKR